MTGELELITLAENEREAWESYRRTVHREAPPARRRQAYKKARALMEELHEKMPTKPKERQ